MAISILIPTYNHDCTMLVKELHRQAETTGDDFEIVVAEDGSQHPTPRDGWPETNVRYIERKVNVGRSAIRNFLFDEAQHPTLLMMDCDMTIIDKEFLKRITEAGKTHDVVCATVQYGNERPPQGFRLRYDYEKKYEKKNTADVLNRSPHAPFKTPCFLMKTEVAEKVRFDERFSGYGYEDVMYGKCLREAGYGIFFIDKVIMGHCDESDERFRKKIDEALMTLFTHRDELRSESPLIVKAEKLKRSKTDKVILQIIKLTQLDNTNLQIYKLKRYLEISNLG